MVVGQGCGVVVSQIGATGAGIEHQVSVLPSIHPVVVQLWPRRLWFDALGMTLPVDGAALLQGGLSGRWCSAAAAFRPEHEELWAQAEQTAASGLQGLGLLDDQSDWDTVCVSDHSRAPSALCEQHLKVRLKTKGVCDNCHNVPVGWWSIEVVRCMVS